MKDTKNLRIAVHGAAGRMGQRVVALAVADPELALTAALEAADHPKLGQDAGTLAGGPAAGVPLTARLDAEADVLIDFSLPEATDRLIDLCLQRQLPLVFATTGLDDRQQARLREAAGQIPVVWAPNMSTAVNLTMKLAETAASVLRDRDADVEILEWHHRFKADAPSGTALKFGQIIAAIMGQTNHRHGRQGRPGPRPRGEIGYHAIRAGDNPGEHTIVFGMPGETVSLTVRATHRDAYARGALAAARFLAGKPAGLYGMNDVLGL